MMTFKDLKKLVELPSYKEQRVPTVKALEVSGVPVVAEKILENHGSISVYQNGYVIYRAHKRVTVFSLRNCVHYKYDALEGAGHHIEEEEFDEYEWHIRLVLEGEDRIFMNYEIIQGKWMPSREDREYKEEILEGVDDAVSTLERMISEERVEELLSTLTDLQRKVVHIHLFHGLSFTEAAKHLGMLFQVGSHIQIFSDLLFYFHLFGFCSLQCCSQAVILFGIIFPNQLIIFRIHHACHIICIKLFSFLCHLANFIRQAHNLTFCTVDRILHRGRGWQSQQSCLWKQTAAGKTPGQGQRTGRVVSLLGW